MVSYKQLKEKQEDYVMHTNFNKLIELIYIKPKDAEYVYSLSEHFLEGEDNEAMRRVFI